MIASDGRVDCEIADGVVVNVNACDAATAEEVACYLIDCGYYQTSRRERLLARLPPVRDHVKRVKRLLGHSVAARDCAEVYLHRVAHRDGNTVQVSPRVWDAFRKLGGGVYTGGRP